VLDNQFLNTTSTIGRLGSIQGLADTIATKGVAEAQEEKSSCSCLEGSPCVIPECCKDWKNRFLIAAQIKQLISKGEPVQGSIRLL
jgi:hypothetical protein